MPEAGAVVDAGLLPKRLGVDVAAGVEEAAAAVVVAGLVPNKVEVAVLEPAAAVVAGVVENNPGVAVVVDEPGALVVAVAPNKGLVAAGVDAVAVDVLVEAAGAEDVRVAPPNSVGVVEAGAEVAGVAAPEAAVVVDVSAGLAPNKGVLDWPCVVAEVDPKRVGVEVPVVAGLDKLPKRPAVLVASVGGAPAGVVDPKLPKSGFAGVV